MVIYNVRKEKAMSITITELKNNLHKYLQLSSQEDIYITHYGKVISKLSNPNQGRVEIARSLFGILPEDAQPDQARTEALIK